MKKGLSSDVFLFIGTKKLSGKKTGLFSSSGAKIFEQMIFPGFSFSPDEDKNKK